MAARAATEAEMLEPWRKNFPICKPYAAHDKADAVRFLRELEEGCDGMDADIDYTLGEVVLASFNAINTTSTATQVNLRPPVPLIADRGLCRRDGVCRARLILPHTH